MKHLNTCSKEILQLVTQLTNVLMIVGFLSQVVLEPSLHCFVQCINCIPSRIYKILDNVLLIALYIYEKVVFGWSKQMVNSQRYLLASGNCSMFFLKSCKGFRFLLQQQVVPTPTQPLRQPHHQQRHMTVLHFDYHDIFMYVHVCM